MEIKTTTNHLIINTLTIRIAISMTKPILNSQTHCVKIYIKVESMIWGWIYLKKMLRLFSQKSKISYFQITTLTHPLSVILTSKNWFLVAINFLNMLIKTPKWIYFIMHLAQKITHWEVKKMQQILRFYVIIWH